LFSFFVHCVLTFAVWMSAVGETSAQQQKPYKCNSCGKVYRHQCSLWRHGRYECGKPAMFQCPICSYRAKQKSNLIMHVYHVHRK
jgi:rubrerythrin